jgi:prohibitin 1
MKYRKIYLPILAATVLSSCTIIRQGEVGVKRSLGKINPESFNQGARWFNPFTQMFIKIPTKLVNLAVVTDLPSKEGLTIRTDISILYRIKGEMAPKIVDGIGLGYENEVILPVFRSAAADITSKFYAKDMHSGDRSQIEAAIKRQMTEILETKGFMIENVLMKNIKLPDGLSRTIEEKLQAEQDAQRMEFVKEKERRDAERRIIEAEGKKKIATIEAEGEKNASIIQAEAKKRTTEIEAEGRANATLIEAHATWKANDTINRTLTPMILKYKQIEAFKFLSNSNNSKLIITDGKTPFLGIPDKF